MPRLEGEKSNASVWIIGLVLLIAVATILYFVFARPGDQPPANVNEPIPSMGEGSATPPPAETATPVPADENAMPGNATPAADMTALPDANATSTPSLQPPATMDDAASSAVAGMTPPSTNSSPSAESTPR